MKVIKLNRSKLDRIIKESDFALIENAQQHASYLENQAQEMLNQTKDEAEEIKKQAYHDVVNRLTAENEKNLADFYEGLEQFLQDMNNGIFSIVYKILARMGLNEISPHSIRKVIEDELSQNMASEIIKISAHESTLKLIREELDDMHIREVIWESDNNLLLDECVCVTKMWTMRVSIGYFRSELLSTLKSTF